VQGTYWGWQAAGNAIAAGAATGGTLAAMSGEDVLAGTLSGGLGGMSGGGLERPFTGVGDAAATVSQAVPQTTTSQVGMFSKPAGVSRAIAPGTMAGIGNPALTTSGGMGIDPSTGFSNFGMTDATMGANVTPTSQGNWFERAFEGARRASGTPAGDPTPMLGLDKKSVTGYLAGTGNITPAGPLQMAMKLGSPLASMGIGGLEESDFMVDPEFNDPRDKYDPYSKLNLNKDTGIMKQ
jgi:hypothetical protein